MILAVDEALISGSKVAPLYPPSTLLRLAPCPQPVKAPLGSTSTATVKFGFQEQQRRRRRIHFTGLCLPACMLEAKAQS